MGLLRQECWEVYRTAIIHVTLDDLVCHVRRIDQCL